SSAISGVTSIVLAVLSAALTSPAFSQSTTRDPAANKDHQDVEVNLITRTADDSGVPLFDKDPSTESADPIVMRTSTTGDLIIEVHAECFITVNGPTGTVIVSAHVEVDGQPVPVAEDDDGNVNFCDRHLDDPNNVTDTTSNSAGFKWVAFNVGSGEDTVQP